MDVAAIAAAAVKTAAGGSISAGIWTLVGLVITVAGTVLVAIVKEWGPWKRTDSDARAADFARLREEIASQKRAHREETDDQNRRIERLEASVETARLAATTAQEHSHRSDAKLQTALTACEVLLGLVEREMPEAPEIKLVKRLLAQAASSDMGVGDGIMKLANIERKSR